MNKYVSIENVAMRFETKKGTFEALRDINLGIDEGEFVSLIGLSGCGKSTLLRTFNRMNDLVDGCRIDGKILLDGNDIFDRGMDITSLRRRVGMVFQKPNPFPGMSIYDNVAIGLRLQGVKNRAVLAERIEQSLRKAALWDEVKEHLS